MAINLHTIAIQLFGFAPDAVNQPFDRAGRQLEAPFCGGRIHMRNQSCRFPASAIMPGVVNSSED
jgi:hypothetical protein